MGARRKGRELAVQALYQIELTGEASAAALRAFWEQSEAGANAKSFAAALVAGVCEQQERIDALIRSSSEHWRFERLSRVDLNVLRVATYELLQGAVPLDVAIDEAIEIGRRFGSEESATFVNGVLDQVATQLGVKTGVAENEVRDDG